MPRIKIESTVPCEKDNKEKEQKIKLETNIRYSSGRFNYLNNFYKKAKKDLLFVLKFGSINLKFKSMIMIILMIKIFK